MTTAAFLGLEVSKSEKERPRCIPGGEEGFNKRLPNREPKTYARDVYVIADVVRVMPHMPRSVELEEETTAELEMTVGSDEDLAGEVTCTSNRLRGLLR
ncbi:IS110 family transposase [Streptomyces anthocyanicus]|uniref:IS110 family transposase n=1 Tax=Streptomyces anthocyanicus TaxID=68174 RepID=UPI002F9164A1|nr:IS110 family transposase [Streptomyces anthocyanicus]